MRTNNKRGISLIVLVITIIVMIILAAAIILSISNSGIIDKANKAKTYSDLSTINEVISVLKSESLLNNSEVSLENVVSSLQEKGFEVKKITDNNPRITELSLSQNELKIGKNETGEIIVSFEEESNSVEKYYIVIQDKYYEIMTTVTGIEVSNTSSNVGENLKIEVSGQNYVVANINQENKKITITAGDNIGTDTLTIKYGEKTVTCTVEVLNIIKFTVDDTEYRAEENMTWESFVASDYNVDSFTISGGWIYNSSGKRLWFETDRVNSLDLIHGTSDYYFTSATPEPQ